MNQMRMQFSLAGVRFWLVTLAVVWLLGTIGLGWLVKSFFVLLCLLLIAPVVGFFGLRWWLKRNLVADVCPVCRYEFTGLNNSEFSCPSCGEPLQIQQGHFHRLTPPGTVDVEAVDVSARQLEE